MSEIKIRSDKPIPERFIKKKDDPYPFEKMNVGDSFYVKLKGKTSPSERGYLKIRIHEELKYYSSNNKNAKFKLMSTDRDSESSHNPTGITCWRIE